MAETADDGSDTGQSADITLVPSLAAVQIINLKHHEYKLKCL